MSENVHGKTIRIVGIHLAGAGTRRTAVVRASTVVQSVFSGLNAGHAHDLFSRHFQKIFPNFPVRSLNDETTNENSPLFWEAFSPEIGASMHRDSDTRLFEVLEDIGKADIYCIDAPLSLPPCLACDCLNKAEPGCHNPVVTLMQNEWEERRKNDRKPRMFQPYLDRFFEMHARRVFNHPNLNGSYEFEAVMGSGRAPITARGIRVAKEIERRFPKTLVIETNSPVSIIGWATHAGHQLGRSVELKHGNEGKAVRAGLLKRFEQSKCATRSAALHTALVAEICASYETFSAGISALSGWGLLNGLIYMIPEFMELESASPFRGWACVPREVTQRVWSQ